MGAAQHRGSTPASHQAALGLILGLPPKIILMLLKFIGGNALKSAQKLDNVNRTHIVLATCQLVLQITNIC